MLGFVHFPYQQGYNQPKNGRPTVSRARWLVRAAVGWLASWLGPWGTGLGVGMEREGAAPTTAGNALLRD